MLPEIVTGVPGPKSLALAQRLKKVESPNVTYVGSGFPVFWEKARGVNVWDVDGNRFVDFTSAFGVSGLGHSPDTVARAIALQTEALLHGMGDVHPTELKVRVCEQLSELTFERWGLGAGKVILGNTGFEAVESALKTALLHTDKPGVISFHNAYHGLGYGTLAAGAMPRFADPFRRQLSGFGRPFEFPHCTCPGVEEIGASACKCRIEPLEADLRDALGEGAIGAVLVEPIQGRGGKIVPPPAFLPMLRRVCDDAGAVLIFDEILTGFNRCGALFAADLVDVRPDLICLGKALGSSLPLSACVGRSDLMDRAWPESTGEAIHTTTHLGNPLACAAALAALELHRNPEVATQVRATGARFRKALEALDSPFISRVRGRGLLLGLELVTNDGASANPALAQKAVVEGLRQGFVLLADSPEGNVLSLVPPFAVADEEIRALCGFLRDCCS